MQVGKAYGRTTYLSTTFQRVPRGTEGAVSVEGTLAGAAASALMAALALLGGQVSIVLGGPAGLEKGENVVLGGLCCGLRVPAWATWAASDDAQRCD